MGELKFKPGDRVRRVCGYHNAMELGDEDEVVAFHSLSGWQLKKFGYGHASRSLELVEGAAPVRRPAYSGHRPDGSSVQNHSAGPLYPYVLVWRDKKGGPDANGKYDVGVIGPRLVDTAWCVSFTVAVKIAENLKEMT